MHAKIFLMNLRITYLAVSRILDLLINGEITYTSPTLFPQNIVLNSILIFDLINLCI